VITLANEMENRGDFKEAEPEGDEAVFLKEVKIGMKFSKLSKEKILSTSPLAAGLISMTTFASTAGIISILEALGIYNPPMWLVYAILFAGTVGAIVGILTSFGLATVPLWAVRALAVAGGVSA
jgi:hypothetical protein